MESRGRPQRELDDILDNDIKHPAEAVKDKRGYMFKRLGKSLFIRKPGTLLWTRWRRKDLPLRLKSPFTIARPRYPLWMVKRIAREYGHVEALGRTEGIRISMTEDGKLALTGNHYGFYIAAGNVSIKDAITEVSYRILSLRDETLELRVRPFGDE